MKTKLAAVIFILCLVPAFGQTVSDIETKYGRPVNAYSVSEHIWMTPEYADNGQVCQMRLYPKRIAPETNFLSTRLPAGELKEVLNQLVPLSTRGAKKASFGITETGGGAAWTTYSYEKVIFIFTAPFKVKLDSLKDSKPYVFSVQDYSAEAKPENMSPSDDDFLSSQASSTEIVTIKWHDRRCGHK